MIIVYIILVYILYITLVYPAWAKIAIQRRYTWSGCSLRWKDNIPHVWLKQSTWEKNIHRAEFNLCFYLVPASVCCNLTVLVRDQPMDIFREETSITLAKIFV